MVAVSKASSAPLDPEPWMDQLGSDSDSVSVSDRQLEPSRPSIVQQLRALAGRLMCWSINLSLPLHNDLDLSVCLPPSYRT